MRKKMRLSDEHPSAKRLAKVFKMMDDAGVRIEVQRDGTFLFIDMNTKEDGKFYELLDADDGTTTGCIPPVFEYKLVYEKEVKDE